MSAAGVPIQSSESAPVTAGAGTASVPRGDAAPAEKAGDTSPPSPPPAPGSAPHRVVATAGDTIEARLIARREDAAWFKALQPVEQAAFRARWQHEEDLATGRVVHRSRSLRRTTIRGGAVFLLGSLMFIAGFGPVCITTAIGLAMGFVWAFFEFGPIRAAVVSGPLFAALVVAFRPDGLGLILSMFGFLIVASLSYAACLSREMRRTDGTE
jgi:hypothetical protein